MGENLSVKVFQQVWNNNFSKNVPQLYLSVRIFVCTKKKKGQD